jgi:hypothetical protein
MIRSMVVALMAVAVGVRPAAAGEQGRSPGDGSREFTLGVVRRLGRSVEPA